MGIGLTRAIVLVCIISVPAHAVKTWLDAHRGIVWSNAEMLVRARIERQLEATPGEHLVIVRYSANHDVHQEWVYNAADIDHSKIVWAREIPGVDLQPLLEYFHNRTIWTVDPDGADVQSARLGGIFASHRLGTNSGDAVLRAPVASRRRKSSVRVRIAGVLRNTVLAKGL